MAEKKTTKSVPTEEVAETVETPVVNDDALVPVFLERIPDPNASQVEFYSLNFKNYLIERGKTVYVPKELKAIIDAQKQAESEAVDFANGLGIRES